MAYVLRFLIRFIVAWRDTLHFSRVRIRLTYLVVFFSNIPRHDSIIAGLSLFYDREGIRDICVI